MICEAGLRAYDVADERGGPLETYLTSVPACCMQCIPVRLFFVSASGIIGRSVKMISACKDDLAAGM